MGGAHCTHQKDEAWRVRDSRRAGGRAVGWSEGSSQQSAVGRQQTTGNVESTTTTLPPANEVGFGTATVPDKSSRQEPCMVLCLLWPLTQNYEPLSLLAILSSFLHYSSVSLYCFSFSIPLAPFCFYFPRCPYLNLLS